MTDYNNRLLIDGKLVEARGSRRYAKTNPSTGEVLGNPADASPADMHDAITAARHSFDYTDWSTNHAFRQRCLQQLQDALREEAERFRNLQVAEAGVTITTATGMVDYVTEGISFHIELTGSYDYRRSHGTRHIEAVPYERSVQKRPHGVAGLITAWNAPYLVNVWKLTPALAAGNTVVLKASPLAPYTSTELARLIVEKTDIPAGVVNVLTSGDRAEIGEALTGDQRVDMFSFTGSTKTGTRVMQRAAEGVRKVELELSGKSANIVFDDADLDTVIPFSGRTACMLSGQGCALPTRLLVQDTVYDEAIDRLLDLFSGLRVGDPTDPSVDVGPVISADQQDRILGLVRDGVDGGSRLVVGGGIAQVDERLQGGSWVQPTLFSDVSPDAVIAQNEIFGPVLSVIRFKTEDDAVDIANSTAFGLAGYVQTADLERAERVALRLRAGGVGVNGAVAFTHSDVPFGGIRASGLGRKNGVEGFEEYLQSQLLVLPAP
jgi:aldehyde dehydrogenase (NAD+)